MVCSVGKFRKRNKVVQKKVKKSRSEVRLVRLVVVVDCWFFKKCGKRKRENDIECAYTSNSNIA